MPDDALRGYLLPEERILWQGRPEVRPFVWRGWWYLVPFSLLWAGFAIFWEINVLSNGAPFSFGIWGIPFVLFGLYLVFGRLFVARREAQHTTYAITDRRILVHGGALRRTFTAIELAQLPEAQLDEASGGIGTITFGSSGGFRLPPGWPTMGTYRQPTAFQSIRDVRAAFDILQRARHDLTTARRSA